MLSTLEEAIVKTLIYADIFDYPLTGEEIWRRLIKLQITNYKLQIKLNNFKILKNIDGYYFLKGRERIVEIRKKRKKWSAEKLKIAKEAINLLRFIPTVKLIGVTGGLSIGNAEKEDDIDLLIITSGNLLWTTRLLTTLLIELTGKRRHPGDKLVKNKICLNLFIDENHLTVPQKERDLFSAHEVAQMKPFYERDNIYQKFLTANQWVKKYLPNAIEKNSNDKIQISNQIQNSNNSNGFVLVRIVESLFKKLQLWYMKKRRTTEVIESGIIRFHPQDARIWILAKYRQGIAGYKNRAS